MPSLLDDLAADIGPPIKGSGISRAPFCRSFSAKQLLQRETWHRTTDDDFPIARLDVEALAIVEPRCPDNLARQPNGEAFSPFADDDLRHAILQPIMIFPSYLSRPCQHSAA